MAVDPDSSSKDPDLLKPAAQEMNRGGYTEAMLQKKTDLTAVQ